MSCDCQHCENVKANMVHDVWIHYGKGTLTVTELETLQFDRKNTEWFRPLKGPFYDPQFYVRKPKGALWFSRGSWSYDPYHEGDHIYDGPINDNAFVLRNPQNILKINTAIQLKEFVEEYSISRIDTGKQRQRENIIEHLKCRGFLRHSTQQDVKDYIYSSARTVCMSKGYEYHLIHTLVRSSCEQLAMAWQENKQPDLSEKQLETLIDAKDAKQPELRTLFNLELLLCFENLLDKFIKDYGNINWDKIVENGFWGVSFDFCKVDDLEDCDFCSFDEKYRWHLSYDVESLMILDNRALEGITYENVEI